MGIALVSIKWPVKRTYKVNLICFENAWPIYTVASDGCLIIVAMSMHLFQIVA